MHATSTRPPGTKRRTMPPAARMRSLGASFGTINSPLNRYTSLTVDDPATKVRYYGVEFAKISLYIGYDNAQRHHSPGMAFDRIFTRRSGRRHRQRHRRRWDLCHIPDVARNRRLGADGQRHDDGRCRTELPRRDSRLSLPTARSSRSDPFAGPVVPTRDRDGLFAPAARLAASLRARGAVADRFGHVVVRLGPGHHETTGPHRSRAPCAPRGALHRRLRRGDLRWLLRRWDGDTAPRGDGAQPALRDSRTAGPAQRALVDHQRAGGV